MLALTQAKPPAFVFAEIDVKDQDGYTTDFLPKAQANIKEFGGKYLGGGTTDALLISAAQVCARASRSYRA